MARAVAGVVLGYLAMFAIVFALLSGAYLALGPDRAFQPGTFDVSYTWIAVWFVVGLLAAIIGGLVCARISGMRKPPLVLAGLVFVLGYLSALPVLLTPMETKERSGTVSTADAMMTAKPPFWVPLMNPIIGVVGVLIGARIKR